nr:IS110 family transposase [Mucilaginibacter rubeus]
MHKESLNMLGYTAKPFRQLYYQLKVFSNFSRCLHYEIAWYVIVEGMKPHGKNRKGIGRKRAQGIFQVYKSLIMNLTVQVKKIEEQIKAVIESDEAVKLNYQLLTSIKCVGPVLAANMIAYTHNFTRFATWRKFACYVGTAPFEHQSGTSIKGRTRVSSLSNKQLKKLIHMVAICACAYNPEMKSYYKRRVSEGKNKMSTLNVIRNKIISRMFAVVNRGSGYVDLMKYAA